MKQLRDDLSCRLWAKEDVMKHIGEFHALYSSKHISRILKKFKTHYANSYPDDYRSPKYAEDQLKKLTTEILNDEVAAIVDHICP